MKWILVAILFNAEGQAVERQDVGVMNNQYICEAVSEFLTGSTPPYLTVVCVESADV